MSRKDYTIDDWRKSSYAHYEAYEIEKGDHQATKLRHDMQWEKATCLERMLLRLLSVHGAPAQAAHHTLKILLDDELENLWREQEDSE